ncbi:MAG: aminotransferase class I/II-fold pyridoxal phosphate-dependent enzyme [Bacteroidia bacterium]
MFQIEQSLSERLAQRQRAGLLRTLEQIPASAVDFCSNDYLGLARCAERLTPSTNHAGGATGSRLISGNSTLAENLEARLADYHGAAAALLFNSGYDANLGFWSCITGPKDTIITDELVHASIIDGVRLSKARRMIFRHNDLEHLEQLLQSAQGNVFIGTESVFSMDGDRVPLAELIALAQKYDAAIVIDEAHSNGILGTAGSGFVSEQGFEQAVFARIHTFGKAVGSHGALILGSEVLKQYLLNFARSFVFTTALPAHSLQAIDQAYRRLAKADDLRQALHKNVSHFVELRERSSWTWVKSDSWIQSVIIPGNQAVRLVAERLKEANFAVKAIVSPTVAVGQERIRICLHSFNTQSEIEALMSKLEGLYQELCEDISLPVLAQK